MDIHALTTQEVAAELGITTRRVLALIRAGRLPAVKHGRDWLIDPAELEAFSPRPRGRPRKQKDD